METWNLNLSLAIFIYIYFYVIILLSSDCKWISVIIFISKSGILYISSRTINGVFVLFPTIMCIYEYMHACLFLFECEVSFYYNVNIFLLSRNLLFLVLNIPIIELDGSLPRKRENK